MSPTNRCWRRVLRYVKDGSQTSVIGLKIVERWDVIPKEGKPPLICVAHLRKRVTTEEHAEVDSHGKEVFVPSQFHVNRTTPCTLSLFAIKTTSTPPNMTESYKTWDSLHKETLEFSLMTECTSLWLCYGKNKRMKNKVLIKTRSIHTRKIFKVAYNASA